MNNLEPAAAPCDSVRSLRTGGSTKEGTFPPFAGEGFGTARNEAIAPKRGNGDSPELTQPKALLDRLLRHLGGSVASRTREQVVRFRARLTEAGFADREAEWGARMAVLGIDLDRLTHPYAARVCPEGEPAGGRLAVVAEDLSELAAWLGRKARGRCDLPVPLRRFEDPTDDPVLEEADLRREVEKINRAIPPSCHTRRLPTTRNGVLRAVRRAWGRLARSRSAAVRTLARHQLLSLSQGGNLHARDLLFLADLRAEAERKRLRAVQRRRRSGS